MMGHYWLGKTKPKQTFRSTLQKVAMEFFFKIYLMEFSND